MADRRRQSQPRFRKNFNNNPNPSSSSSSSSSSSKFNNNRFKSRGPNPNNVNQTRKPTSRNWETHQTYSTNDDGQNQHVHISGTCPFMCPVEEMERRERLRDLAVFERLNGNPAKSSSSLAVKKFCRTITARDAKASDIRPVEVLEDTLNYLLGLLDSNGHPFEVIHDFVFDRTRSIRQDLSMQNVVNNQVIHMYERMVKFHILSHHRLEDCHENPNIASIRHLNMEQLIKALLTLFSLYGAHRAAESIHKYEAEFHSFYVLLHLGSSNEGESLSLWFRRVPSLVMKSEEMSFARKLLRFFRLGNYVKFIYTVEAEASFLQYCIVEPYISEVRALAVSCVNCVGYKPQPYPLVQLSNLLMMKDSDVETLCRDCGLQTSTDESGKGFLPTKQTNTCDPKQRPQNYYPLDSERLERLLVSPPLLEVIC